MRPLKGIKSDTHRWPNFIEEGHICLSYLGAPRKNLRNAATVAALDTFIDAQGYRLDFAEDRHHHEIYLGDPRRSKPENLRTIIRHPVETGHSMMR